MLGDLYSAPNYSAEAQAGRYRIPRTAIAQVAQTGVKTTVEVVALRWPFFLFFENFESMQRNSKTRASEPAETSSIESSSKSGLEKVFKS